MNPLSPQVKSVEAFQRDLEPAIIAARNELVTAENFMAYKNSYSIDTYDKDGKTICSFHSRMFFFTELDTDHHPRHLQQAPPPPRIRALRRTLDLRRSGDR